MSTAESTSAARRLSPMSWVLVGGLAAATLDLIYISLFMATKGVGPVRILHFIAAGWIGNDASKAGGDMTAMLGLATHYGIAIVMSAVYYFASRRLPSLTARPWFYGALYGLALYVVMTFGVVPLSAVGGDTWPPEMHWVDLIHLADHMLLVGVPIALAARCAAMSRSQR